MSYIDVDPEPVSSAGHRTAQTSSDWDAWAGRCEAMLRQAAATSGPGNVGSAFEGYLSDLNPLFKHVARQANALGVNAVSAANDVTSGDHASAAELHGTAGVMERTSSALSRPITAP